MGLEHKFRDDDDVHDVFYSSYNTLAFPIPLLYILPFTCLNFWLIWNHFGNQRELVN